MFAPILSGRHGVWYYNVRVGPRITFWRHEAGRVMTHGDPQGRIFLSHPHRNYGFIFLLTIKLKRKLPEVPAMNTLRYAITCHYAEMRHNVLITMTSPDFRLGPIKFLF